MERINSIDQDLIFPLREACKGLGQVVPRHGEKHHFTSRCFVFRDSGCATAKLVHNFSQAFWSAVVANFYVEPSLFFFSSRRRHTRLQGDWSSDVCSSD